MHSIDLIQLSSISADYYEVPFDDIQFSPQFSFTAKEYQMLLNPHDKGLTTSE